MQFCWHKKYAMGVAGNEVIASWGTCESTSYSIVERNRSSVGLGKSIR